MSHSFLKELTTAEIAMILEAVDSSDARLAAVNAPPDSRVVRLREALDGELTLRAGSVQ